MKKLMKSLMLFAAAAMALTSCENEAMNEGIEANDTYTMNFVAGAPESKTSVTIEGNAAYFTWDGNEEFVFIQHKDAVALGTGVTFTKNGETATISATFTGDAKTEYNHVAVYPASAWVDGTEVESSDFNRAKLTVKNKQELVKGKYDPTADLMVSQNVACVPTDVPQALQFTRLVSVAEMNIKNLAVEAGEKITSVDFAVSESVIAGRNYYDLATGKVVEYGYSDSYRSNNITLSGEGIDANSTSVKVYFTCNPVTVATGETYTVTVTTDKAKYTKSAELTKDLAFEAGKVKAFGVNMTGATKENLNDLSGTYIIVAKGSINYYYMSTWKDGQSAITGGNNRSAVDSGVSEITDYTTTLANFENIDDKYIWNVTAVESGYTLSNKDNSAWLYLAEKDNRANMTTTKESAGTFSIDKNSETNVFTVVDKKYSRTLAYNSSSSIFACYASGQNPALYFIRYKEDTRTAQNLSFGATTEFTITLGEEFTKPTLTGAITTVTYSSSDTNVAEVNASTGVVTIKAAGTAIITATAPANDTYKSGSASYTVTVKEKQQGGGESSVVEDTLTATILGTASSYSDWSGKKVNTAVYAGNSMTATGGNAGAIQLRSSSSNSGIVTTTSGGKITKVTITNKSGSNNLQVYGKNTAYTKATDLYDTTKQGTLLGTIKCGTATTLEITGDYAYVGVRSQSGAIYLTDITFTWATGEGGGGTTPEPEPEEPGDDVEESKTYTLLFGSDYNSGNFGSYSNSWSATCDGFTWNITNANNNNCQWNYIKMGSKNAASTGTIVTNTSMPEAIKTVSMTIGAITSAAITSIKLYVATDNAFSKGLQTITATVPSAASDVVFNIPTPTTNCYYKIEVVCTKNKNGTIQINKVTYAN